MYLPRKKHHKTTPIRHSSANQAQPKKKQTRKEHQKKETEECTQFICHKIFCLQYGCSETEIRTESLTIGLTSKLRKPIQNVQKRSVDQKKEANLRTQKQENFRRRAKA